MKNDNHAATCFVLGVIAAFAATKLGAQEITSSPTAATNTGQDLSEIVVTAQRRSERDVDVPITITTLDPAQLSAAHVQTLADIAALTPALRFDSQSTFVQPTIRGVGTTVTTPGSGANVGIYLDGFYSPNPLLADFQLLNVQDVQVLKGPQGTLFGRNTTGGAILVSTSKPSMESSAVFDASYGRFNEQVYQAYATTGVTDRIAVDVAALYAKGNGYVTDIVTGSDTVGAYDRWSVRTGLNFQLSDAVSILFRYYHYYENDPTLAESGVYTINGVPQSVGALVPGAKWATAPDDVAATSPPFSWKKSDAWWLTATFDFDFGTLTSYTQYRKDLTSQGFDLDHTTAPIYSIILPIDDTTVTQEFLLNSKREGPLQWTAGLFFLDYTDSYPDTLAGTGLSPYVFSNRTSLDSLSFAGYADATYQVTPQFFLTGGVRYSRDESRDAYYYVAGVGQVNVPTSTSDKTTPRVVLRYKPNDESSAYLSVARGYHAPFVNVGDLGFPVQAENMTAYEIGYKYARRALSVDLSAYYYDYKDLQVSSYTGTASIINNAATADIRGVDSEVRYEVLTGFEVIVGASYLDAKFKDYQQSPSYQQCLNFAACGPAYGLLLITNKDASGLQLPHAPEFTGNVGARYTTNLGGGQLSLSGNFYHTSYFFFDSSNQFRQPAYNILGLRATWTDPSGHYTVGLWGDNVTNSHYFVQVQPSELGIGTVWSSPVTYGGEVRVKF